MRWAVAPGSLSHAPVVGSGIVFVSTNGTIEGADEPKDACAYAYSEANGRQLWRTALNVSGDTVPTLAGDRLIVTSMDHALPLKTQVVCLDAISGREIWHRTFPAIMLPICGTWTNKVALITCLTSQQSKEDFYALDCASGDTLWNHSTDAFGPAPVSPLGTVYFVEGGKAVGRQVLTGRLEYSIPSTGPISSLFCPTSQLLATIAAARIPPYSATLRIFNLATNKLGAISFPANGWLSISSSAIYESSDSAVYAWSALTGSKLWVSPGHSGRLYSSEDGTVLCLENSRLVCLNHGTGHAAWSYDFKGMGAQGLAIGAKNDVLINTDDGRLLCIQ